MPLTYRLCLLCAVILTGTGAPAALSAADSFRDCNTGDCPEMLIVPAGQFEMGDLQNTGHPDEKPVRSVTIEKNFSIGKYEVTLGEYRAFVRATNHDSGTACEILTNGEYVIEEGFNWQNPGFRQAQNHPVTCIKYSDAQAYTAWLSLKTGFTYRLPSEAEWEYAARAGSVTDYPWGNRASHDRANFGADKGSAGYVGGKDRWRNTAPVGSFAANAFGLLDMHGNIWELTQDCWNETYSGAPNDGSAMLTGDCSIHLMRGGAWDYDPGHVRSSVRVYGRVDKRTNTAGFRVLREFN